MQLDSDTASFLAKVGFPSFEEFSRNPDKYRDHPEEILKSIDNSFQAPESRVNLRKQTYYWNEHKMESLEHLQRVVRDEGLNVNKDVYWEPIAMPCSGVDNGKFDVLIKFYPKQKSAILTP